MAKNGLRLLDSDMHIIEPPDLWQRYIDTELALELLTEAEVAHFLVR
jgi:hypothetical protein